MDYIDTSKSNSTHLGFALMALVDCTKDKYITFIREVFATKDVDFSIMGDIEDIEMSLGLREKRDSIREGFWGFVQEDPIPQIIVKPKVGRNDPCPCGSGKKYKKCCLNK